MSRRFQFSLRALLGLAAVVCLLLGCWHLLTKHGQYVVATPAKIGEPITVDGQLVCFCGPSLLYVELVGEPPLDRLVQNIYVIKRSWGCLYRLKTKIDPISRSGDDAILLRFQMKPGAVAARGVVTVTEQ
jgi:hypothetical protein